MKNTAINRAFYNSVTHITNKLGWKDPFRSRKFRKLLENNLDQSRTALVTIADNTLQALENNQQIPANSPGAAHLPPLGSPGDHQTEFLFKLVRDVFVQLQTRNLIGVQPMNGPVGLIYQLMVREDETDDEQRNITMDVVKRTIEARTRKFHARWGIEAQQDIRAIYGSDLEEEVYKAMVDVIVEEITSEHLAKIRALAETNKVPIPTTYGQLETEIQAQANDIAKQTRRGCGNWIVVPEGTQFAREYGPTPEKMPSATRKPLVKSLCMFRDMDVYVASTMVMEPNTILIGYKGNTSELDSGMFYSPYVMLFPMLQADAETFQPNMQLLTRYGFWYDQETSPYYYRAIKVN